MHSFHTSHPFQMANPDGKRHTDTHADTRTHTHTHSDTHTQTDIHAQIRTHTHTHPHSHTKRHTCERTDTHTHTHQLCCNNCSGLPRATALVIKSALQLGQSAGRLMGWRAGTEMRHSRWRGTIEHARIRHFFTLNTVFSDLGRFCDMLQLWS